MTLTYGFYNSVSNDRLYNAIQISNIFDGVINDGVYASVGDCFIVSEDTGMNIKIGTGRAWFNHTWTYNDAEIVETIAAAHPLLDRYDSVILEVNADTAFRVNSIKVISGTPASTPVPPALTNTETLHQYRIANILVEAGVTSIVQSKITNLVGQSNCPFVTGPLSVISINSLIAQWEAEWHEWFDFVVNELTQEQFGNLQNQINQHNHSEPLNTKIVTDGIENSAITDLKLGNRTVKLKKIQGGSTTPGWGVSEGTINADVDTPVKIQAGFRKMTIPDGQYYSNFFITYPEVFDCDAAYVFLQPYNIQPGFANAFYIIENSYNSGCYIRVTRLTNVGSIDFYIYWMAIGAG